MMYQCQTGENRNYAQENEFRKQEIVEVPLSELFGYATRIRSLSQGRAIYTLEFKKYEICRCKFKMTF